MRKVNISGNTKTRDEVIRREVRQLEGAWYDGPRIERSKVRIRRLGYFEPDINIETPPVPGSPDQVDIEITVTEKSTGNLLAGVGYSSADGVVFSASVSQQNVFGSGNALSLSRQHEQDQPHLRVHADRAVLDGRRRVAHDRVLSAQDRSDRARDLAVRVRHDRRRARLRRADHRDRHDQPRRSASTARTSTLFADSPPIYFDFINQFGNPELEPRRLGRLGP